jgi:cytochrome c-type biogenesis protein CcmH
MARVLVLLLFSFGAFAQEDPALEKRVRDLSSELRCLVCQNQTLADSHAPLAVDLRNQVREQLKSGKSERDVVEFLVARYGDFVLYRPPLKASTLLLWIGPFLLLALGVFLLLRRIRRTAPPPAELSDEDRARAAKLLE